MPERALRRHAYARHTHETYALAAILEGCETFFHRGRQHYATPGAIALVGPDKLHDGAPHDERGFVYRTLYPSVDLMREVAEEISGKPVLHPPRFRESVVDDPELAALLAEAHRTLERPHEPLLARDARVVSLLSLLIVRYTDAGAALPAKPEPGPVANARAYLDARFAEDVDLLVSPVSPACRGPTSFAPSAARPGLRLTPISSTGASAPPAGRSGAARRQPRLLAGKAQPGRSRSLFTTTFYREPPSTPRNTWLAASHPGGHPLS